MVNIVDNIFKIFLISIEFIISKVDEKSENIVLADTVSDREDENDAKAIDPNESSSVQVKITKKGGIIIMIYYVSIKSPFIIYRYSFYKIKKSKLFNK
jgi:hypothetical protein